VVERGGEVCLEDADALLQTESIHRLISTPVISAHVTKTTLSKNQSTNEKNGTLYLNFPDILRFSCPLLNTFYPNFSRLFILVLPLKYILILTF
jgi:hypothetical protein